MNRNTDRLWSRLHALKRAAITQKLGVPLRITVLLFKRLKEKEIPSLAQSLAYATILSIVPLVAIFFFILGKITENIDRKQAIMTFVTQYFIPEYAGGIFGKLEKLSEDSLAFGAIGFPTLFLVGVLLYTKVSSSINKIWECKQENKWFKNGLAFFMTLFFGPMLLVLVFSIPPYLQTLPYYREYAQVMLSHRLVNTFVTQAVPVLISTVGLLVLYQYIPATSVRSSSAMRGAFAAAILIQGSNLLVEKYLSNFSNFNVVYGSLAIVPIFLLWVFAVWLVVLTGATLTYIHQFHRETNYKNVVRVHNNESLFSSAVSVLIHLSLRFAKRNAAPTFDQLHISLGLNRKRLTFLLDRLQKEGLIVSFQDVARRNCPTRYQPGILPSEIYVQDIHDMFGNREENGLLPAPLNALLRKMEIHPGFLDKNMTIQEMVDSTESILSDFAKRWRNKQESKQKNGKKSPV